MRLLRTAWGHLRHEARFAYRAGSDFYEHHNFTSAAAVAFWGMLTVIPFVLLLSGLFGVFVDWLGGPDQAALVSEIVTSLRRFFPRLDPEVARYLEKLIADGSTLSLGSIPLFLIMSSALLGTLEHAIGCIYHPKQKRTVARSTLLSMIFVVALLFLLVAAALAGMTLARLSGPFGAAIQDLIDNPFLTPVAAAGLAVLCFSTLVRSFAIVRIPKRELALGGIVFAVFWVLARIGFSLYLETIAAYDLVYGSLAMLVVLLIWLYYTAVLFLYAAEWVQVRRVALRLAAAAAELPIAPDQPPPGPLAD